MSQTAVATEEQHGHLDTPAATALDFDRKELASFGADDGEAVTAIGKMLVVFFFYSFLVMCAVGWWTWSSNNTPLPTPHDAHAEDLDD